MVVPQSSVEVEGNHFQIAVSNVGFDTPTRVDDRDVPIGHQLSVNAVGVVVQSTFLRAGGEVCGPVEIETSSLVRVEGIPCVSGSADAHPITVSLSGGLSEEFGIAVSPFDEADFIIPISRNKGIVPIVVVPPPIRDFVLGHDVGRSE